MRYLVVAFSLAGCATGAAGTPDGHPHGDAPRGDGPRGDGNGGPDAPGAPGSALLLSEVALTPTGGEFIEIVNPSSTPVSLTNYYLSDNGNYFKLPAGTPVIGTADFIAHFPQGSSIAAGGVITVAISTAAAFNTTYGQQPTYSVADATITKTATNGTPSLTDAGEIIVLFEWDGVAPLVKDVDLMIAGVPASGNGLVSKSMYTQSAGTYATDANTLPAQATAPGSGKSTKRIAKETGEETQAGTGNGIDGDDETSEITTATWDTSYTAPTPGQAPTVLLQ